MEKIKKKYPSDNNLFEEEYFGNYATRKKVNKWRNTFVGSNLKVINYSYLQDSVITTKRWFFSKEGTLDSVVELTSFNEYESGVKLSHIKELVALSSFYHNGFIRERCHWYGVRYHIKDNFEKLHFDTIPNYVCLSEKYSYSNDYKLSKLILTHPIYSKNDFPKTISFQLDVNDYSQNERKVGKYFHDYTVYKKDYNLKVIYDSMAYKFWNTKIDSLNSCNLYQYIPFWGMGFHSITCYYNEIRDVFLIYNRRWFDKCITMEYYD